MSNKTIFSTDTWTVELYSTLNTEYLGFLQDFTCNFIMLFGVCSEARKSVQGLYVCNKCFCWCWLGTWRNIYASEIVNLCRYSSGTATCSCALQKHKAYFCKTLILKVLLLTSSSWITEGPDCYHCKSIIFRDDISEYVSLIARKGNANYHLL